MKINKPIVKLIGTFFCVGYLPLMPGTFGSLAGLVLYFLVRNNIYNFILCTVGLGILGFLVTGKAEEAFRVKDPRYVVIDEVVGMLLSLMLLPFDIKLVILGFFFFRLLDTIKPFPASSLQVLKGSKGIMLDDIVAGVYTNIILQVLVRLASFKVS